MENFLNKRNKKLYFYIRIANEPFEVVFFVISLEDVLDATPCNNFIIRYY